LIDVRSVPFDDDESDRAVHRVTSRVWTSAEAGLGQLLGAFLQWRVDDVVAADHDVLPRGQRHTSEVSRLGDTPGRLDQPGAQRQQTDHRRRRHGTPRPDQP
jgi:hypothetical protein